MKKSIIFQSSSVDHYGDLTDKQEKESKQINFIFFCTYLTAFLFFMNEGILYSLAKAALFLIIEAIVFIFLSEFFQ